MPRRTMQTRAAFQIDRGEAFPGGPTLHICPQRKRRERPGRNNVYNRRIFFCSQGEKYVVY